MTITRAVGVAALSMAFAAGAVAPAVASVLSGDRGDRLRALPPYSLAADATAGTAACSALASQLVAQISAIGTDLTAVPPKTAALTGLVGQLAGDVAALQNSGCLPSVPGVPAPNLPAACVADVANLMSDGFALLGDLNTVPPNVTGALSLVSALTVDVTDLVVAKCLPPVTVPVVPGLPSVTPPNLVPPIPVAGQPTTASNLPVPAPVLPTVPKLPVPVPTAPTALPTPPTTPSLPLPTTVPKLPVPVPTLPAVPSLPLPTTAPKLPVPVPTLPTTLPTVPKLPAPPSLPSVPSLPTLPGVPSLPALPSAPSVTST